MKLRSKEEDALKMLWRLAKLCITADDITLVDLNKMYYYLDKVKEETFPIKIRENNQ